MMQTGLHIGLAAWINNISKSNDFLNCPSTPKAIKLVDLENVSTMDDQASVADFSSMTNFIPRNNKPIDYSDKLWRVHRDLIGKMNFATEPWNELEKVEYENAVKLLYKDNSGFKDLTDKYKIYLEMKSIYDSSVSSGASMETQNIAFTEWIVRGYKIEIDKAINTVNRLTKSSSVIKATSESQSLEEPAGLALNYYGSSHFAPVSFSPISAISSNTWMEAEVSFNELDRLVNKTSYKNQWNRFKANRNGRVLFNYVVLECNRTWFTHSLYENDDWKFNNPQKIVSEANGEKGELPAYVSRVYLAIVKEIKYMPKNNKPSKPNNANKWRASLQGINKYQILNVKPSLKLGVAINSIQKRNSKSLINKKNNSIREKVRPSRSNILSASVKTNFSNIMLTPLPLTKYSLVGNESLLRIITKVDLSTRFNVASMVLNNNKTKLRNDSLSSYMVGFGCNTIPLSPNPNPNYQW